MQSTQAQYKRAFADAYLNFFVTLEALETKIGSQLFSNTTLMQMDATIISSQLHSIISSQLDSIRASNKNLLDATKALEALRVISANAKEAMTEIGRRFRALEEYLTMYIDKFKQRETGASALTLEDGLWRFKRTFQSQFNELQTSAENAIGAIGYIVREIDANEGMEANDIEAISRQVGTECQIRKRKAEHQSLGDESVSSKRRNDTQPVVAESASEPDTMLSSATVSSYESAVRYQ